MSSKEKKWTLEEGLQECADMEKGKKHMTEDYVVKIGVMRPCHKCGKPVEVINYTGFDLDWLSITYCDKHQPESPIKPPFKKCTDPDCEVHKHFDEEKWYNEGLKIEQIIKEINELFQKVKPKNDSVMEYDRMHKLFGHSHPHLKPDEYEFWLFNEFMNYMALNNKLRI